MPELRIEASPYDKGVPVRKTSPLAKLPVYGSAGAAAADVCGINEERARFAVVMGLFHKFFKQSTGFDCFVGPDR